MALSASPYEARSSSEPARSRSSRAASPGHRAGRARRWRRCRPFPGDRRWRPQRPEARRPWPRRPRARMPRPGVGRQEDGEALHEPSDVVRVAEKGPPRRRPGGPPATRAPQHPRRRPPVASLAPPAARRRRPRWRRRTAFPPPAVARAAPPVAAPDRQRGGGPRTPLSDGAGSVDVARDILLTAIWTSTRARPGDPRTGSAAVATGDGEVPGGDDRHAASRQARTTATSAAVMCTWTTSGRADSRAGSGGRRGSMAGRTPHCRPHGPDAGDLAADDRDPVRRLRPGQPRAR